METLTPTGLMADLSNNGNAALITGTTIVAGKYGNARSFNGTSDQMQYFKYLTGGAGSSVTVTAWIYPTTLTGEHAIVSENGNGILFEQNGAQLSFWANVGNPNITSTFSTGLTLNAWNFVAVTYSDSSGAVTFYIGTVSNAQTLTANQMTTAGGTGGNIGIFSGGRFFSGTIDEIYVYNRILSTTELSQLMDNSPGPLLKNGNEVRWRDSANSKEWFRGRIKDVQINTLTQEWQLKVIDNLVVVSDRSWTGRRSFPAVPANVIMDEAINSGQGQPQNGQVLRFDMETLDASGNVLDLSGNANNGTLTGSPTSGAGWYGLAYTFPFSPQSYVSVPNASSLQFNGNFSIAGFFNEGAPNASGTKVVNKLSGTTGYAFGFILTGGVYTQMFLTVGDGAATTTFQTSLAFGWPLPISYGGWGFYGVTYNTNGTATFYGWNQNGGIVTQTVTGTARTPATNTAALIIGSDGSASVGVDDMAMYNRLLSSSEMQFIAGAAILAGSLGTVSTFTSVAFQSSSDSRLSIVDALARAVGAEYFVDRNGSDQDEINLVSQMGSPLTATFQIGAQAFPGTQQLNTDTLWNDVTVLGQGDGSLQLISRNFYASTIRTTLSSILNPGDSAMNLTSTSAFPTSGVVYVGMERLKYTGKSASQLTGLTHAYSGDGVASLAAYAHASGIEVYLHTDNTTYYRPDAPQTGSSIALNGWKQGTYSDKAYNDQNGMDRLAQRIAARYSAIRESLSLAVTQATVACDLGDTVTVNDYNGSAYLNSPYRIVAYEYDYDTVNWSLELANYRDSFDRRVSAATTVQQRSDTYTQGYLQGPSGIGISVATSATTKAITFTTAQTDAAYGILATPSWNTTRFVTGKTTSGFTLNFGTAAPANATVDWTLLR